MKLDPQNGGGYLWYGALFMGQTKGVEALDKAVTLLKGPAKGQAYVFRADSNLRLKNYPKAKEDLDHFEQEFPGHKFKPIADRLRAQWEKEKDTPPPPGSQGGSTPGSGGAGDGK